MAPALRPDTARSAAAASLRAGLAVQAAALAWLAWNHGTVVDSFLFVDLGWPEPRARGVDLAVAAAALGGALLALLRPRLAGPALVAAAFLAVAVCTRVVGGRAFSDLAPAAHATRWLAPLALPFLFARPPRARGAERVLRAAVAATFLAHGWEALRHHPAFVDLLVGSARRWLGAAPDEATARHVLTAIGVVDGAVAALLLIRRRVSVAAWAALWGLLTAASRVVALGGEFVHETTLRALNVLAPLALALLWSAAADEAPPA